MVETDRTTDALGACLCKQSAVRNGKLDAAVVFRRKSADVRRTGNVAVDDTVADCAVVDGGNTCRTAGIRRYGRTCTVIGQKHQTVHFAVVDADDCHVAAARKGGVVENQILDLGLDAVCGIAVKRRNERTIGAEAVDCIIVAVKDDALERDAVVVVAKHGRNRNKRFVVGCSRRYTVLDDNLLRHVHVGNQLEVNLALDICAVGIERRVPLCIELGILCKVIQIVGNVAVHDLEADVLKVTGAGNHIGSGFRSAHIQEELAHHARTVLLEALRRNIVADRRRITCLAEILNIRDVNLFRTVCDGHIVCNNLQCVGIESVGLFVATVDGHHGALRIFKREALDPHDDTQILTDILGTNRRNGIFAVDDQTASVIGACRAGIPCEFVRSHGGRTVLLDVRHIQRIGYSQCHAVTDSRLDGFVTFIRTNRHNGKHRRIANIVGSR